MNFVYQCKKELFWFLFYIFRCDLIMMRRERSELTWQRDIALSKGGLGKEYDSIENQRRIMRLGQLSGEIRTVTKRVRWAYFHYCQARKRLVEINYTQRFHPA